MIFNKNRVEEDLEKIRNANLPDKKTYSEANKQDAAYIYNKNFEEDDLKLEKGDLLAMILAVMSLILPYVIAFVGIMAGVMFLLGYFY